MRNETQYIKSTKDRTLTAKALKFKSQCIEVMVKQYGLTRYHHELKPLKLKLSNLLNYLFIDERKSINEIKEIIKQRNLLIKN